MKNDLLLQALYSGKDIPDVIKRFEKELRDTKDYKQSYSCEQACWIPKKQNRQKSAVSHEKKHLQEIYSLMIKISKMFVSL